MITWEQARKTITQHFIDEWASHLDYFIEGHREPDMGAQTAPFARLTIDPTRTVQIGMLGPTPPLRSWGTAEVTVFVPFTRDAKVRLGAIDKLIDIFAARTVDEIVFQGIGVLSVVEGKDWRSQTVIANFYFEHQTGA